MFKRKKDGSKFMKSNMTNVIGPKRVAAYSTKKLLERKRSSVASKERYLDMVQSSRAQRRNKEAIRAQEFYLVPNRDLTGDMSIEITRSVQNSQKTIRDIKNSRKMYNQYLKSNASQSSILNEHSSLNADILPS